MRVLILLLCGVLSSTALATPDGTAVLQGFYDRVESLSATFTQTLVANNGDVLQKSTGIFLLSRPDRFRWVYKSPYKQIIVSDGETFSFYDVGLSQVTIRDVGNGLRATPAKLLAGGANLESVFEIQNQGTENGLHWIKLKPQSKRSDFKTMRIGFKQHVPAKMILKDQLGQTTRIQFNNVKVNPTLSADRFQLDIPDDVTVVNNTKNG